MFFHLIFFPLLKKFWVGKDLIIIIIMMMVMMIRKDKPRVGHLFIWKWLINKFNKRNELPLDIYQKLFIYEALPILEILINTFHNYQTLEMLLGTPTYKSKVSFIIYRQIYLILFYVYNFAKMQSINPYYIHILVLLFYIYYFSPLSHLFIP